MYYIKIKSLDNNEVKINLDYVVSVTLIDNTIRFSFSSEHQDCIFVEGEDVENVKAIYNLIPFHS